MGKGVNHAEPSRNCMVALQVQESECHRTVEYSTKSRQMTIGAGAPYRRILIRRYWPRLFFAQADRFTLVFEHSADE
jgi:hypothetical protein